MNKLTIKHLKLSATTVDFINNDFGEDLLLSYDEDGNITIEIFGDLEGRWGKKIDENVVRNWLKNCQREIDGFAQPVFSEFKVNRRKDAFKNLMKKFKDD